MTIEIPTFGSPPDWDDSHRYTKKLNVEMLRCSDRSGRFGPVNVLHTNTDLESVRSETDRIISLMDEMRFDVRREPRPKINSINDIDVVIVGSKRAHADKARYLIKRMSQGFLRLVPEWDGLWYGTDYTPNPLPNIRPLCAGSTFALEAVSLIHAHIRRREDSMAWRGSYVSMLVDIEDSIDDIMNTGGKVAAEKICAFENRVRRDGCWGDESDLFFAAVAVIRDARNMASHTQTHRSQKKRKSQEATLKNMINDFNTRADKYSRSYLKSEYDESAPDHDYKRLKWINSLAQVAVDWVSEYAQHTRSALK